MSHRGVSRPMRAGGLVLLGVAAVAAVIGTASAVSGDDEKQAAPPPEDPGTSEPAEPGGGTTSEPAEETTASSEPETTESSAPAESRTPPSSPAKPTGSAGSGNGSADGGKGDADKSVSVRVYNNSKIKGLASRAADDLRANGWNVVMTGNYSSGRIYTTTVYYRPGTAERGAAEAIGAEFGMRVEPRFDGIADSTPGVIVIVTKDYSSGK